MAHKKAAGTTKNNRDSTSKRLGVKIFGGQKISVGNIILRQRGTKFHPGQNVGIGSDDTLFSLTNGTVQFRTKKTIVFTGNLKKRTYVDVVAIA